MACRLFRRRHARRWACVRRIRGIQGRGCGRTGKAANLSWRYLSISHVKRAARFVVMQRSCLYLREVSCSTAIKLETACRANGKMGGVSMFKHVWRRRVG